MPQDIWNPSERHTVRGAPAYTGKACEKGMNKNTLSSIKSILIYNKPLRNLSLIPNSQFQKANWSSLGNEKLAKLRNSRPKVEEKLLSGCGTCISCKRGKVWSSTAAKGTLNHRRRVVGACRNSQWNGIGNKSKGTNTHGSKASGYHLRQSSGQMTPTGGITQTDKFSNGQKQKEGRNY